MRNPFTGWLAMVCATAIAISSLRYGLPFVKFQLHFYQQESILDLLENAAKPQLQRKPAEQFKINYVYRALAPLPPPDLPYEPVEEPPE